MRNHGKKTVQMPLRRRCLATIGIISIVFFHRAKAACVSSCTGKLFAPFSYQSCDSCKKYVMCDIFGRLTTYDCLLGMVYEDTLKLCLPFLGSCADYTNPTTTATTSTSHTASTATPTASNKPTVSTKSLLTVSVAPLQLKPITTAKILLQNLYIKIVLQTAPCLANASSFQSAFARSKTECAGRCNHDRQCWYFQVVNQTCLMYSLSLPPCDVNIYKYIG